MQAAIGVHRDAEDALTLVLAPAEAGAVAAALERYHFSEELELLGPEDAWALTVAGMPAPAGPAVPGVLPGTVRVVVDDPVAAGAALPGLQAPPEALEMARVAAGVARVGVDTGPSTLVQEAALEDRAVSFTKGCYLGQETVARLQFRGKANRALRGLAARRDARARRAGDRRRARGGPGDERGATTPDLGAIGLAILRREVAPGDEVEAGGVSGRVARLPFAGR